MIRRPCVYLVGAGPGDPGLVTVRGRRYLELADVVVYDHQIDRRLLRAARPEAEKIDVGPTAPKPMDQEAISLLLVEKARERKAVVRLKWGDPFVFDSGGKEALFLHEQGVPFEVVPGVPAITSSQLTTSPNGRASFTTTIPRGATKGLTQVTAIVTTDAYGNTTDRTVINIT